MLRNYLLTAWRSLRRNAGTTAVNVAGLGAGLACVILIGLWVNDELSYDAFHENSDRTYRLVREWRLPNLEGALPYSPPALAPTLNAEVPEVERAVRVRVGQSAVEVGDQRRYESGILFSDPGFFEVFDFPLVRGTADLSRPNTVLLTPKMAARYFPNEDPIGKTIQLNVPHEVTGIVKPAPATSSLEFDFVVSLKGARGLENPSWTRNMFQTFVLLQPQAAQADLQARLTEMAKRYLVPSYENASGNEAPENSLLIHAQPLTDVHLGRGVPVDLSAPGSMTYVMLFGVLAGLVLLLACINFMNLATAQSLRRANEVGVRKAMGARGRQLIGQFLGESFLTTGLALGVAVLAAMAAMPLFNHLAGKSTSAAALLAPMPLLAMGGLWAIVGLAAGSYPAFVLSRYQPTNTLRSTSASSSGHSRLRQGLVITQFAISIVLLIGLFAVQKQTDFLTSTSLGFTEENVVVLDRIRSLRGADDALAAALERHSSIQGVASGFALPGTEFANSMWRADAPNAEDHNLDYTFVSPDYLDVLQVDLIAGRDLERGRASDSTAAVLNRAAAAEFGWSPEEAVGQRIQNGPDAPFLTVIGVTEDFHYESLHQAIQPMAIFHQRTAWHRGYLAVRIHPEQRAQALDHVRATWSRFSELPPDPAFLASRLAAQYRTEHRLASLMRVFAGLATLIAVLGLMGLATYAARQRRKEIGIRKALGATVHSIIGLLSKDFLLLVGIAFVVAAPIGYYAALQWMERFPYHTEVGGMPLLFGGSLAALTAALAVSHRAWSAARTDPVNALYTE